MQIGRTGIHHPDVVDLVTSNEESLTLVVVEEKALVRDDAPALQEKLNNYLIQSLDEKFATLYPEAAGKQVFIRVDLYAAPDAFIVEFLRRYSEMLVPYGVGFHAAVKGIEVA